MLPLPAGREAGLGDGVPGYQRHRPERTLLYQLVAQHYPAFADLMAAQGRPLPDYVQREFEDYRKCGRLDYGFLRVRCTFCHQEQLVAFSWPLLRIPAPAALVIHSRHKRLAPASFGVRSSTCMASWRTWLWRISSEPSASVTMPFSRHSLSRPKNKRSWFGSGWRV